MPARAFTYKTKRNKYGMKRKSMKRKNYPCESTFPDCAYGDIPAEHAISQYQGREATRTFNEARLRQIKDIVIRKGGNIL